MSDSALASVVDFAAASDAVGAPPAPPQPQRNRETSAVPSIGSAAQRPSARNIEASGRDTGASVPIAALAAVEQSGLSVDLAREKVLSFIAPGDVFEGSLKCKTGICIAGELHGDVECESGAIVLTETGVVLGSLRGKEKIYINGNVGSGQNSGDAESVIHTPDMVVLQDRAVVNADIEYGKLATSGDMTHNGRSRKIQPGR